MEYVSFGEVITEYSEKAKNDTNYIVCSVTNYNGFQKSDETFDKQIFSSNLSLYKKVYRNSFAYNPSLINVGSIGIQNIDDCVLVSPLYNVFNFDSKNVLAGFINYFLHSSYVKNYVNSHTQGSVRSNFKMSEMKKMNFPKLLIDDQKEIVDFLDNINSIIDADKRQLELYDELVKSRFVKQGGII